MNTIRYRNLNLEDGQFLLDMGCGEGRHSIGGFIESSANVIGLDLCLEDVQTAKTRLNDFDFGDFFKFSVQKKICRWRVPVRISNASRASGGPRSPPSPRGHKMQLTSSLRVIHPEPGQSLPREPFRERLK